MDHTRVINSLEKRWQEDPATAIRWLFHLRSLKSGFGLRAEFRQGLIWITYNHPEIIPRIITQIPHHGCWKDLNILIGTPAEGEVVNAYSSALVTDLSICNAWKLRSDCTIAIGSRSGVGMAAKWCPSPGSPLDKSSRFCSKLASTLHISVRDLRKKYLVPLRQHLNIPEIHMCTNHWQDIDYNRVPRCALARYSKVFVKRDPERFIEYSQIASRYHRLNPEIVSYFHNIVTNRDDPPCYRNSSKTDKFENLYLFYNGFNSYGLATAVASSIIVETERDHWYCFEENGQKGPTRFERSGLSEQELVETLSSINYQHRSDLRTTIETATCNEGEKATILLISEETTLLNKNHPIPDGIRVIHWLCRQDVVRFHHDDKRFTQVSGYDSFLYRTLSQEKDVNQKLYLNTISRSPEYAAIDISGCSLKEDSNSTT